MPKTLSELLKLEKEIKNSTSSFSSKKEGVYSEDDLFKGKLKTPPNDSVIIGHSENGPVSINLDILCEQKIIIGGTSGSGKSYCQRSIIEQILLHKENYQFIIIDPDGFYRSLRMKFENIIFIGKNGDLDLNSRNASDVTEFILDHKLNTILDYSFYKNEDNPHEIIKIVLESLFYYKSLPGSNGKNSKKIILVLEEASQLVPSKGSKDIACYNIIKDLTKMGRKYGITIFFTTQKLKDLKTDVRSECTNCIAGKTHDEKDIKDWTHLCGMRGHAANLHMFMRLDKELIAAGQAFDHYYEKDIDGLSGKAVKFRASKSLTSDKIREEINPPSKTVSKLIEMFLEKQKDKNLIDYDDELEVLKEKIRQLEIENKKLKNIINERLEQQLSPKEELAIDRSDVFSILEEEIDTDSLILNFLNETLEKRILLTLTKYDSLNEEKLAVLSISPLDGIFKQKLKSLIERHLIFKDPKSNIYIIDKKEDLENNYIPSKKEEYLLLWKNNINDDFCIAILDKFLEDDIDEISKEDLISELEIDDDEIEDFESALDELKEEFKLFIEKNSLIKLSEIFDNNE